MQNCDHINFEPFITSVWYRVAKKYQQDHILTSRWHKWEHHDLFDQQESDRISRHPWNHWTGSSDESQRCQQWRRQLQRIPGTWFCFCLKFKYWVLSGWLLLGTLITESAIRWFRHKFTLGQQYIVNLMLNLKWDLIIVCKVVFNVRFQPGGTLMSKTFNWSQSRRIALSVIDAYDLHY